MTNKSEINCNCVVYIWNFFELSFLLDIIMCLFWCNFFIYFQLMQVRQGKGNLRFQLMKERYQIMFRL